MMWLLGDDFEEDINDDPEERKPQMVNVGPLLSELDADHDASTVDDHGGLSLDRLSGSGNGGNGGAGEPVRSPLAKAPAPSSRGTVHLTAGTPQMVPLRVAEALQEEARRHEETAVRRQHASFHGSQPPSAEAGSGALPASSYHRPSLQQRSRLRTSRLSAGSTDYSLGHITSGPTSFGTKASTASKQ